MNTEPLTSVIIPTHNDAAYIEVAIRSILNQTYKNLEILVVDDGSTDTTAEVVKKIATEDARVEYLKLPFEDPHRIGFRGVNVNAGYAARNFGFKHAKGEWITFQDADDASLRNRIEVQHALAQKYDALHVSVDWQQFREELVDKKLNAEKFLNDETRLVTAHEINALAQKTKGLLMHSWFPHAYIPFAFKWFPPTRKLFFNALDSYPCAGNTPLFKREVIEKVQFRDVNHRVWPSTRGRGADRDFCFQVAETFGRSIAFKIPLYLWRVKTQNSTYTNPEKDTE
ncbi:MAG: glycosyltransferase family 2 protein [Patescibacteria group bacterium]